MGSVPGTDTATSRVSGSITSSATVGGSPEHAWDEITNVDIGNYALPAYLKLAGIPHPLRAEVNAAGVGGERIAYFDTGKRFIQRITVWDPPREYAFTFNPESGFKVVFFFDLSDGVVQIPSGSYLLDSAGGQTVIRLSTQYSIDRRLHLVLGPPVRIMLRVFQRYLLRSIAGNVRSRERS